MSMRASPDLPQWESRAPASSRRDALHQESGGYGGNSGYSARTVPPPIQPYIAPPAESSSTLRRLWNAFWAVFFFSVICGILGVTVNSNLRIRDLAAANAAANAAAAADGVLGLPAPFAGARWSDVLAQARGTTVRFASWSDAADPQPLIDPYIVNTLGAEVLASYGVVLKQKPLAATSDAVATVTAAARAGTASDIDLIWINGKNFKNLSQAKLLYGPFAPLVPNGKYFDFTSSSIRYDFGYPTMGYEMPYNAAQFTLIYNSAMVPNPPTSMLDLAAWIVANPGKFAYPVPSDANFESAVLLRHFFGAFCSPYLDFMGNFNEALYMSRTPALWAKLNELQPKMWRNATTGKTQPPASLAALDALFASGQVAFTFTYDPLKAAAKVAAGAWNATTTRSYVFTTGNLQGTIGNINFVAIPSNAPNLAGALVVANAIASPAQMFARAHPEVWGTFPAFAPLRMDDGWNAAFGEIAAVRSPNTPDFATLQQHALGELDSAYNTRLEADWALRVNATV